MLSDTYTDPVTVEYAGVSAAVSLPVIQMNKFKSRVRPLSAAVAVAVALSLTACGGGGGTAVQPNYSPPPAPAPAPTPAPSPSPSPSPSPAPSPQPPIDAQLALTDTYAAHNAGFTGKGITIGIVDTGVMRNNAALYPRVKKDLIYVSPSTNNISVDDVNGHGTWVSEIAAGQSFDQFPGGIAPGANIVSARVIDDKESNGTTAGGGLTISQEISQIQQVNNDLENNGAIIQNNSWGGITWSGSTVGAQIASAYQHYVVNYGGLVVFASGNDGKTQPDQIATLPQDASYLEQGWIVAAALDSNNPTQLASYSNQCGVAMNYCISAPGDVIVLDKDTTTSSINPTYWVVSGTSFAAPEVSGAAAVVWQAFPYFNNDMVRQTILSTATDLGAPGVDAVFGWGALDVGKAVKGPANFAWGDVSVSFDSISSEWSNDIVGAGGLSKNGTGTLVLSGHDSYTGDTQLLGGNLQFAHAIPGNASVSSGAWLTGMYASGSTPVGIPGVNGNLNNGGNVLVAGGSATVTGNYVQAGTGSLNISLGSVLNVNGSASLDGNLNLVGKDAGYVNNAHQDLLTAAGGVTGTFATFTLSSGVFLSSTVQYDVNDVWIDTSSLSVTGTFTTLGYSANPVVMGTAQRVDGAFQQINQSSQTATTTASSSKLPAGFVLAAGAIQHTQTISAAAISMKSLSGQLHAASAAMALQGIEASNRGVTRRLDALDAYGNYGMWTQDMKLNGTMARSGFDGVGFQLSGWMFGGDRRLGSHGMVGFAMSQSHGDTRLDQSLNRNRSDGQQTLAYVGWSRGHWYSRGQFGFGEYRQDISRRVLLGYRWFPVSTWYNGSYRTAYGESGLHFGRGADMVTPFVNVQYARLDRNGFAEQGAFGFGLKAGAQTVDRWQAGAGLRATHRLNFGGDRWVDLSAHAQWQHTLASHGGVFDASFVGVNDWRPLAGVGLSRTSALVGVNLAAQLGRRSSLNFGYDVQMGPRVHAKQVMAKFSLAF